MMVKRGFEKAKNSREVAEAAKIALQEEWNAIPQELVDRWYDNFHSNLRLMVERKGQWINV